MYLKFLVAISIVLNMSSVPLLGGWSAPAEVIYPTTPPNNAANPFIATDGIGNSVAVWFDTTASGSMQAAKLASGAVNGSGQPSWVLTNPIATSNVQAPGNSYAQAVGMDLSGNATAIWTDGLNVYASTLAAGQNTWGTPAIINTQIVNEVISNLYITVAPSGTAIVTWISSTQPRNGTLLANVFDPGSHLWRGQTDINAGAVKFKLSSSQVAIDPQGNAVVSLTATSNQMQAIRYNFNSNTWTGIASTAANLIHSEYTSVDSEGNATIVWIEEDNTVHAATLAFNQTTFTNQTLLSTNTDASLSPPLVTVDLAGNAVAIWPDATFSLAAARFSSSTQTWTALPLLDLGGNMPAILSLSGDAKGNVVASWTVFLSTTSYIESAALAASDSSWKFLTQLSPTSDSDTNSQVCLTKEGDALALWENDINNDAGTINSSIFLRLFYTDPPPPPPVSVSPLAASYFKGKVVKNKSNSKHKHRRKKYRVRTLQWEASPDPAVVKYCLYRNSKQIAVLAANQKTFSYTDIRRKKIRDTYKLICLNAQNQKSRSLYKKLK